MNLRLAKTEDLPQLKIVYNEIIKNMYRNNIKIWNEIYPYVEFPNDIEKKNLYLLTKNNDIVATFAISEENSEGECLKWKNPQEKAIYIKRIGVNVNYLRQGIGGLVIKNAIEIAKQKNVKYLRLLVVTNNKPAINLYLKNGFEQVEGLYDQEFEDSIITEYGFELEI